MLHHRAFLRYMLLGDHSWILLTRLLLKAARENGILPSIYEPLILHRGTFVSARSPFTNKIGIVRDVFRQRSGRWRLRWSNLIDELANQQNLPTHIHFCLFLSLRKSAYFHTTTRAIAIATTPDFPPRMKNSIALSLCVLARAVITGDLIIAYAIITPPNS